MSKTRAGLISALIGVLLAACSQAPLAEAPKAAEPSLGTASITSTGPYTEGNWYNDGSLQSQKLISPNQGFCYLAGIQGRFDSGTSITSVYITQGNYVLHGGSTEWAKAICVDWSALKINFNAFTPVRWLSDEFSSYAINGLKYTDTWFGDAVTYLTSFGGNTVDGGGAFVIQSSKGDSPSQLLTTSNKYRVEARARAMFFGKPHVGDMPQFWGPKAQGKTYSLAGYYFVQSNYQSTVEMAPTDKAFCYLQYVNGSYDDTSDWAWIYRSTNSAGKQVWKLGVHDGNPVNGKFVGAGAACYMLAQN